ncbi:GNAT family N-acetyltransferase [Micromonospora sp. CPCC 205556]|uniref:GNAT family N-acetyltransferase n=1 Tax=Micromonospora sp. CPCC 205556 TaxID=3122398 RepID=UPI003FA5F2E6
MPGTSLGWYFHPDAWGRGYASEAAVLRHAFEAGLQTVLAVTHPDNVASQGVCRRLGIRHHGPTDRYNDMTCEFFSLANPGPRPSRRPGANRGVSGRGVGRTHPDQFGVPPWPACPTQPAFR